MLIRNKWYKKKSRSISDISSAIAFINWRIAKDAIEDLINEDFYLKKPEVFAIIAEYLYFLIQCTDRLIVDKFEFEGRKKIIVQLAKYSAQHFQENKAADMAEGEYYLDFLQTFNKRTEHYSKFGFMDGEPNNNFLCYFGEKIKEIVSEKDKKWIAQQMIEIQAPKAFEKLKESVNNLTKNKS